MGTRGNMEMGPCNVYFEEDDVDIDIGYVGTVTVTPGTTASPMTASQKGESPVDKVVSGGSCKVAIEFKELTFENYERAFPGAVVTGDGDRVDFLLRVGLSLRSLAKKVTIKRIVAGVESTDSAQWLVFPELSPSEGEFSLAYDATTQRVMAATFDAWPGDSDNRFFYFGDELAS